MEESKSKHSFCEWVKLKYLGLKILFRSIPSITIAIFFVSVVVMNLMANKVVFSIDWIAFNGGVFFSWIPCLCMDVITKHYGAKVSNIVSVVALIFNLACSLLFYIVSIIGVNEVFDSIFRGTWFIVLSSAIAFLASAIVNNYSNVLVAKLFKKNPEGKLCYVTRTYVSTFIGQVVDNILFLILTYMVFGPIFWGSNTAWTFIQCLTCAVVCALGELILEVVFSPIGYEINKKWKEEKVGEPYFEFVRNQEAK